MKPSRVAVLAVLFALLLAAPSFAVSPWAPFGPSGGNVRSLALDPSAPDTLYAGTYGGGVFQTTDGGVTWSSVAPEIRNQTVHTVALEPSRPQTVFAGTHAEGVWRSLDGGATWKRVLHGGREFADHQAPIAAIAVDPSNSRIVYAATDTGPNDGVHRSADGGATWVRSTAGLPHNFRINTLAIDLKTPTTLYAGLNGDGVFKSVDAGKSWAAAGEAMRKEVVLSFAIDPSAPGTLYAGTINNGLFKSTDGGATWAQPSASRPMKDARVASLAIDAANPAVVWAGISNGLLRSADGGKSWTDTMPDINNMAVRALALDPSRPGRVHAGTTRDGVLRTSDAGRTWVGPGTGFWSFDVTGVVSDPSDPKTAWVATSGGGVFKTADGGATWAVKGAGMTDRSVSCLLFVPASRTLFVGTANNVFASTDGAEKWTPAQSGLGRTEVTALAVDPGNPKTLYARDDFYFHRSTDGGVTWTQSKADLDVSGTTNGLFALTADAAAPNAVFTSVYRQFWKSGDGGTTFTKSGSGLPLERVEVLLADPGSKALYAGTEGEGVYKSNDGGASWTASHAGMGSVNVQALLLDPATGAIYAGTWKKGVFVSKDGGKTWGNVGGEPPHPDVIALALDRSDPGRLLVGTAGGSVWRLDTTIAPAAPPAPLPTAPAGKKKK
jgi:photosystem II stability/assembly factor-like uncharacterized protein